MQFSTKLEVNSQSTLMWYQYIIVPATIVEYFGNKKTRLIMTINAHSFNVALMPNKGEFFINMGKPICSKCNIKPNMEFSVDLKEDTSEFGMEVCEEFYAYLKEDSMFNTHFYALNPGAKRSLLHIINKIKSTDKRILKITALAEHLREWEGKLNFKALQEKFKSYTGF